MSGGGRARVHAGELPAASAALPSISSNTPRLVEASRLLRRRSSSPWLPSAAAPAAPAVMPLLAVGPCLPLAMHASSPPAAPSSTLPARKDEAVSLAVCMARESRDASTPCRTEHASMASTHDQHHTMMMDDGSASKGRLKGP